MLPSSYRKRLLHVELAIVGVTLGFWWYLTDRTWDAFSACLCGFGLGTIALGFLILIGAWTGTRTSSIAYLRAPTDARLRRDIQYIKRAYSDLNLLAMAGVIALIVGVALYDLA